MAGYVREKGEIYNKQTNPHGEVSFANAENVGKLIPFSVRLLISISLR